MSAALKIEPTRHEERVLAADDKLIIHAEARSFAVAKFRELADRLESGELDGARVQWRAGNADLQLVTIDNSKVQLVTFTIEEV